MRLSRIIKGDCKLKPTYILAISLGIPGIEDELVETGVVAVKEADIDYSSLAGVIKQKLTVGSTWAHI